jgi:hypothetical protein
VTQLAIGLVRVLNSFPCAVDPVIALRHE